MPEALTPARRQALAVLHHGHVHRQMVRVSNATTAEDQLNEPVLTVYWQVAEWLITQRYARVRGDVLILTDAGRDLAEEVARG